MTNKEDLVIEAKEVAKEYSGAYAFPLQFDVSSKAHPGKKYIVTSQGLSKREYFAAMAMQGLINTPDIITPQQIAGNAVMLADYLIEALNEEPK